MGRVDNSSDISSFFICVGHCDDRKISVSHLHEYIPGLHDIVPGYIFWGKSCRLASNIHLTVLLIRMKQNSNKELLLRYNCRHHTYNTLCNVLGSCFVFCPKQTLSSKCLATRGRFLRAFLS